MEEFSSRLRHPVIFNGGVSSPAEIERLSCRYAGVMVGRGLLARPSLFAEYRSGIEYTVAQREELFLSLVNGTYSVLGLRLCGASQLRDKMKPYWEYAPASMDRKIVKSGKKNGI